MKPAAVNSSLKTKRTARKDYCSRKQARANVFDYVERFYNSTLGYIIPIKFKEAREA
jgi:putative transposase